MKNEKLKIKNEREVYVLLAPPASGKDTQAALLSEKLGLPVIATGDVVRELHAQGTQDGLRAVEYLTKGVWVPDTLIFKMLRGYIRKFNLSRGAIFVAVPRRGTQCPMLEELLKETGLKIRRVFHLDTHEATILERLQKRVREDISGGKRKRQDDDIKVIKNRIREHKETVAPILEYYRKKGILERIDNAKPIKEVFEEIVSKL